MKRSDFEDYIIIADIIKSKYVLRDEPLYRNELTCLVAEEFRILDIAYCEIKNLNIQAVLMMNRAMIILEFDLVFVYEYNNIASNYKLHNIYSEKAKKIIYVEKSSFSSFFDYSDSIRCQCRVKEIRYIADIDFSMTKLSISVLADIECLILEKGIIELTDIEIDRSGWNKNEAASFGTSNENIQTNENSNLSLYYMKEMMDINRRFEERIENCEKQIIKLNEQIKELKGDHS